jgi:DedD protein
MTTEARDVRENDEDGFHEINLSGKQLVFLGMATTIVSIVIFLCGVLVGRGVRPVEAVAEAAAVSADAGSTDAPVPVDATPAPAAAANEPTPTPDVPPADEPAAKPAAAPASAPATTAPAPAAAAPAVAPVNTPPPAPAPVKKPEPAKNDVAAAKPSTPPAAIPAPAAAAPAAAANREADAAPKPAAAEAPAAAAPAAKGGGAIAVQVGAYRERGEADQLAKKLSGKGYAVYIVSPDANAANPMFRVRVGNYSSQDEASRVKRRLEQEEKLKPWIIR